MIDINGLQKKNEELKKELNKYKNEDYLGYLDYIIKRLVKDFDKYTVERMDNGEVSHDNACTSDFSILKAEYKGGLFCNIKFPYKKFLDKEDSEIEKIIISRFAKQGISVYKLELEYLTEEEQERIRIYNLDKDLEEAQEKIGELESEIEDLEDRVRDYEEHGYTTSQIEAMLSEEEADELKQEVSELEDKVEDLELELKYQKEEYYSEPKTDELITEINQVEEIIEEILEPYALEIKDQCFGYDGIIIGESYVSFGYSHDDFYKEMKWINYPRSVVKTVLKYLIENYIKTDVDFYEDTFKRVLQRYFDKVLGNKEITITLNTDNNIGFNVVFSDGIFYEYELKDEYNNDFENAFNDFDNITNKFINLYQITERIKKIYYLIP